MVDLNSGERRGLGPGRFTGFVDDTHIGVARPGSTTTDVIDLSTGTTQAVAAPTFFPDPRGEPTSDGYILRRTGVDSSIMNSFSLTDPRTGAVLLQFDAGGATPAGRGTLAVDTVPVPTGEPDARGYRHATTNIFLVDIATGTATFVATGNAFVRFPLVADDNYVIWTDGYCEGGHARIYDRRTHKITEVEASLWPITMANGLILEGAFGGRALIDPSTLQYRAALPPGVGDTSWSPDYRYASLGQYGGHGGMCP